MDSVGVKGVDLLEIELSRAKENLKGVDSNIKKITGRDPTEPRPLRRPSGNDGWGRGRIFNAARRSITETDTPPAKKRIIGTAFSRLGPRRRSGGDSDEDDDFPVRRTVQSVIAPTANHSREEMLEEQSKDEKGKARNKRMFGLLVGTLRKFKDEAKEKQDKVDLRKQIEDKLEEKAKMEKEEMRNETRQLFQERRKTQEKVKTLEQKVDLVQAHKAWEKEVRKLQNFIRTRAKPHIFYFPKIMDQKLEERLKESQQIIETMVADRKKKLEKEIEELMANEEAENEEEEKEEISPKKSASSKDDSKRHKHSSHRHRSRSHERRHDRRKSGGKEGKENKSRKHKQRSSEKDHDKVKLHRSKVSFSSEDEDFEESDTEKGKKEEAEANFAKDAEKKVNEGVVQVGQEENDTDNGLPVIKPVLMETEKEGGEEAEEEIERRLAEDRERERKIVMAEDQADMDEEPADE